MWFNRTFKGKMWKYFTANNTRRYLNVLQPLVNGYNRTHHSSIKMRPADVRKNDSPLIRQRLYAVKRRPVKTYKYTIGDVVRISKARRVFDKGYLPNWTEETFIVYDRRNRSEPFYYLRDYGGEDVKGGFYEHEIQRVNEPNDYRVEAVLSTKKVRGGKTLRLVKWLGWPSKFNSWVEDIRVLGAQHGKSQ